MKNNASWATFLFKKNKARQLNKQIKTCKPCTYIYLQPKLYKEMNHIKAHISKQNNYIALPKRQGPDFKAFYR